MTQYKKILDTVTHFGQAEYEIQFNQDFLKFIERNYSLKGLKSADPIATIKKFNLKGFTFGNYVTQEERYFFVYYISNQLEALAKLKGNNDLGFGKLIISFGADGKPPANAHFNASANQINLNRGRKVDYKEVFKGEDSFYHEYGHFLDYNKGKNDKSINTYASSEATNESKDPISYLINAIVNKVLDDEKYINGIKKEIKGNLRYQKYLLSPVEIWARLFEVIVTHKIRKSYPTYDKFVKRKYKGIIYLSADDIKRLGIEREVLKVLKGLTPEYKPGTITPIKPAPKKTTTKKTNIKGDNFYINRLKQGKVIDLPYILKAKTIDEKLKLVGSEILSPKEWNFTKNPKTFIFIDKKLGGFLWTDGKRSFEISQYGTQVKKLGNATKIHKEVYEYYKLKGSELKKTTTKKPTKNISSQTYKTPQEIFNLYKSLKKGNEIIINYGSAISKDNEHTFKVTKEATKVGKAKVERIILINIANPKGVRYYLYNRNEKISLALGDMAATINFIKKKDKTIKPTNGNIPYLFYQSYYDSREYIDKITFNHLAVKNKVVDILSFQNDNEAFEHLKKISKRNKFVILSARTYKEGIKIEGTKGQDYLYGFRRLKTDDYGIIFSIETLFTKVLNKDDFDKQLNLIKNELFIKDLKPFTKGGRTIINFDELENDFRLPIDIGGNDIGYVFETFKNPLREKELKKQTSLFDRGKVLDRTLKPKK